MDKNENTGNPIVGHYSFTRSEHCGCRPVEMNCLCRPKQDSFRNNVVALKGLLILWKKEGKISDQDCAIGLTKVRKIGECTPLNVTTEGSE